MQMSNKIILELEPSQVEKLAERLPIPSKIHLMRKFISQTWADRLDIVVQGMRKRIKEAKISDKEIERLCEEVKSEYDEKHHRH